MSDPESHAWERVRAGESAALAVLFDAYEARLFRHASRLLSVREDAKDAVAIAFVELWKRRASVRDVGGSPLPWLLNTVALTARNLERSARRYRIALSQLDAPGDVPEVRAADESGALRALRRLSAHEQAVIVLVVLEGYSERDAADALGIRPGTVKSRLSRAKSRLRGELEEWV